MLEQVISYSIIQKSRLESAYRLDAEYYQPEYLKTEDILGKLKTALLSDVCKITDGNHSKISEKFSDVGIRYLRGMDLSDFFILDSDPVYIPDEIYKTLKRSYIFQNDVLVSIVGTVGLISIVADRYEKLTGNCKIAILHPKYIDPWFLATFLACRYGQAQIKRKVAGAVQTGIILKDLANIVIPVANGGKQEQVKKIIQKAYECHVLSKSFYSKAEDLLLEELGLKDFKPTEELSYIVNLSNVKSAHRADAEYYQPKYEKIIEKIKKLNIKLLCDLASLRKGFEPGSDEYQNKGKLFIRVSNISKHGLIDKDQKYLSDELYQKLKKDFEPRTGEILLTKDATPGIAYVLKESVEGIIAGGILRLVSKEEIETEYLALFINSMTGQVQIERDAGGSVIVHWKPDQVKKLQVPILSQSIQKRIADLVLQSHQTRKKAKELLEKAKREVEEFVEKN
jgi:restriction endonuclease S subunit